MTRYVIEEKGDEVISERHQKDYKKEYDSNDDDGDYEDSSTESFTDVDFDDI